MSSFYATNKEVKRLSTKLDLLNTKLDSAAEGDLRVQLSGTIMEYYGATVAQRPEATEVPVGATYMAVNTGDVWQSNGTDWVVI